MEKQITKSIIISSLIWKLLEKTVVQGVQFIIQIILARLLLPEEFGVISIVIIFITLANVFIQSGFNTALIQKKNTTELDFSSAFYLSLFVAIIVYVGIYIFAPVIATFYEISSITPILRVLSLTLFMGVINSIQNAIIAKNMMFEKLLISSLGGIVLSGTLSVALAYNGFGVWALVIQQLLNQLIITIILWFTVSWRPSLLFSFKSVKVLFSFGWKILASSLIDVFYTNTRGLLIGKLYSPVMLGYYNRGQQIPSLIISNVNNSLQAVLFPALAKHQNNPIKVKEMVRRSIVTSSFIILPVMVGLCVTAEPLILLLLTDKWLPAVPFLQMICIAYAFWPIHTANLQAVNALGRSDIFLKLEVIKKSIGLIILIISIPFGIYMIVLGEVLVGLLSTFINAYPNNKLLNYSYIEQLKDIMPSLILSIIMGLIVYSISFSSLSVGITLLLQVIVGMIFYLSSAKVLKLECLSYILLMVQELLKKKSLRI